VSVNFESVRQLITEHCIERGTALGEAFKERAQSNASRRTGEMAESVESDPVIVTATSVQGHIECGAEYGIYQDEGTGIYGPRGERIVPVNAQALRFDSPVLGIVFAKSVRGSEPTRWWTRTVMEWPSIVGSV
jgi:hypothetical protein